jgi:hypothetical protein
MWQAHHGEIPDPLRAIVGIGQAPVYSPDDEAWFLMAEDGSVLRHGLGAPANVATQAAKTVDILSAAIAVYALPDRCAVSGAAGNARYQTVLLFQLLWNAQEKALLAADPRGTAAGYWTVPESGWLDADTVFAVQLTSRAYFEGKYPQPRYLEACAGAPPKPSVQPPIPKRSNVYPIQRFSTLGAEAQLEPAGLGAFAVGTQTSDATLLAAAQAIQGLSAADLCTAGNATVRAFQNAWNSTRDGSLGPSFSSIGMLTADGKYGPNTAIAGTVTLGLDPAIPAGQQFPAPCSSFSGGAGGGGGGGGTSGGGGGASSTPTNYTPWLIGAALVAASIVTYAELKKHKHGGHRRHVRRN